MALARHRARLIAGSLLAGVALFAAPGAVAQTPDVPANLAVSANINISPKRVVFNSLGRTSSVYIYNQGTDAGTFDIQLIDRIMLPNGQIVPMSDLEQHPEYKPVADQLKSAREMMLTTPRRARLLPGKGQTIRIRAGAPAEVPQGEYRTHLTITAVPPADAGITAEEAAAASEGELRFRVNSVLGVSIPLILRVGPADVRAGVENVKLTYEQIAPDGNSQPRRTPVLSLDLVRVGASSLFGNVEIRGAAERGSGNPLGFVRGVGVYPEIARRTLQVQLTRAPAPGEELEVVFRDDDVAPGKQLARTTIKVP
ncbi:hypothetical protein ACFOMD_04760 [Sphingoaurantiacus capsulatus]|uniref:Molecular chaperone n=1 Tax=Sphingoaurantiacus capsulatus TaxID=1771310 RepID=A0ABV7X9G4_9SPHN